MIAAGPWTMGVVVPARQEADVVGACIASLRRSLDRCDRVALRRTWIVVVADRCTDATVEVARSALGPAGEVLELSVGNVGTARRAGVDLVLERVGADPRDRLWLASTDADTVVPPTWAAAHLALARAGAAAVAGIVRVDSFAEHGPVVAALHRESYVVHGDGSHPHVHGANLGVRADAYLDAGGWTDHETGEDHDLWERVGARGWPRVSAIDPWVTTSGRRHGRAPDGFAGHLAALADTPVEATPLVDVSAESPAVEAPSMVDAPVPAPSVVVPSVADAPVGLAPVAAPSVAQASVGDAPVGVAP